MRRLPIFFVVDVSESMVGEPIQEVTNGIKNMVATLRQDPNALETAYLSILVFAGRAKTVVPLSDLIAFYPPQLPIGSGTSLAAGLRHLMHEMDNKVVKNSGEIKGDWKPVIFLFTDGVPTDDAEEVIRKWETERKAKSNLVAVSVGANTDFSLLKRLTDNVLILNDMTPDSYRYFFKWVTDSIKTQSQRVESVGNDEFQISNLDDAWAKRIDSDARVTQQVDDNYVVLFAKCQKTLAPYLMKYKRNSVDDWDDILIEGKTAFVRGKYVLTGAFPIASPEEYAELSSEVKPKFTVNANDLEGLASCPCCGNPPGFGQCHCGGIHCLKGEGENRCPHCGQIVEYVYGDDGEGFEINRAQG